jgi:hypothetical protein
VKMAGRLGAAPSELSFGDSVAQAGARPVALRIANAQSLITEVVSETIGFGYWSSGIGYRAEGVGAVAGNRTRMVAVRKDLRGGEVFWLLNHKRGN